MEFRSTEIEGVYLLDPYKVPDHRGTFVKTFHAGDFETHGLRSDFKESYYSESVKNVIRGMHFQTPPFDHDKLVFCTAGKVIDVVVDLRKSSGTFGKFASFELDDNNKNMIYVPSGVAHGFCTISDKATMIYNTTSVYNKEHDSGILYDSFGFEWPVSNPILSVRDLSFEPLMTFKSPF